MLWLTIVEDKEVGLEASEVREEGVWVSVEGVPLVGAVEAEVILYDKQVKRDSSENEQMQIQTHQS